MDFGWSSTQRELYENALRFARHMKAAAAAPSDTGESGFPGTSWEQCGEFGLMGLSVPTHLGGMGLDSLTTAHVLEAFGRGCDDSGLLFSACAHLFACTMPIAEHGSSTLRETFVPRLASGALIGANAISESDAGSDVFALTTRAVRDGDDYVLHGLKSYVTNGPVADIFLVYAATRPEHGFFGLSAFVLEKGTPGLIAGRPFRKVGLHSAPTGSLQLDGCRIPASHLLGEEGQGATIFQGSMAWERSCLFAAYLGAMERDLERAVGFANERRQFGRPIGKNQAISHRIANMKLRLESARLLLYRACWLRDSGEEADLEVSLAKLAVSEAAIQSGLDLIQIHGALGVTSDSGLPDDLLHALPSTIFSGTSEMQRDIVARSLGL